jgi:hypothetical protein
MKPDKAQKLLEIDLTDALRKFNDGRNEGRSEAAEIWFKLYSLAQELGYMVSTHSEHDKPPVALIVSLNPEGDKDLELKWMRARELYKDYRARSHNDVDPMYVDRWTPNSKDKEVMAQLGIKWETTPPQLPEAQQDLVIDKVLRRSRFDPQVKPQ